MSEHEKEKEKKESECWPVVFERPLTRVERRRWRRFRDPDLLPALPPGCVYVFTVGNRQETCRDGACLRGDEPMLVDASWVSAVSTRFRRISVWTRLPTTEAAIDFWVSVAFGCQVDDPGSAAANGPIDLRRELQSHVRYELDIVGRPGRYAPDDVSSARTAVVDALVREYSSNPPRIPGLGITFIGAVLDPPRELLRHQAQLRDTAWTRREQRDKHDAEAERAENTERDLLCTPERAEATAVAWQQRTADQAALRQFQDRDAKLERLATQVKEWLDSDQAKRAPIDRRQLAEALFTRLLDNPGDGSGHLLRNGLVEPPVSNGRPSADVLSRIAPDTFDEHGDH